ncbi:hypothetical protein BsWGS_02220 [Bradybaena similaris]
MKDTRTLKLGTFEASCICTEHVKCAFISPVGFLAMVQHTILVKSATPINYLNNDEIGGHNYDKIPAVTEKSSYINTQGDGSVFLESCPSFALVKIWYRQMCGCSNVVSFTCAHILLITPNLFP